MMSLVTRVPFRVGIRLCQIVILYYLADFVYHFLKASPSTGVTKTRKLNWKLKNIINNFFIPKPFNFYYYYHNTKRLFL